MAEQTSYTIMIREAEPQDASQVVAFLNQVGKETSYLTIDEIGVVVPIEQYAKQLADVQASPNNVQLLACIEDKVLGMVTITADFHYRIAHIGELFIAVLADYQGYGIARLLMQEAMTWVDKTKQITRLSLTVQKRNQIAVKLYEKFGFVIESTKRQGAKVDGQLIDVYEMVRFFNEETVLE